MFALCRYGTGVFGPLRVFPFLDASPEDALRQVEQETREVDNEGVFLGFIALELQNQKVSGLSLAVRYRHMLQCSPLFCSLASLFSARSLCR